MSAGSQETTTRPQARPAPSKRVRPPRPFRRRITVRRVDPWTVLKVSLLFYFCVLLIVMVALALFWSFIIRVGLIAEVQRLLEGFRTSIELNGDSLARAVFLFGLINVLAWSAISTLLAVLYNLIADLVGGIRFTLAEDDPAR